MKVNMGQPNDLLLDDLELLLREIDEFNTAVSNNKPLEIPQCLENYLQFVAKSGNTVFPWPHIRNLIRTKMVNAIQEFQEPTCPNETFVLERFDLFRLAAPFTVQRLTELILQPMRHYRKKEKFLRGLEKTVLVVSTIEPQSLTNDSEKNGNDTSNTSASSLEQETETVGFNRTITIERDILNQAIPTVGVLNPISSSENAVLDSVTTTAVSTSENVLGPNISLVTGTLLTENVPVTTVSSVVDVITPEKVIPVSSDDVVLNATPDATTASILSMETSEVVVHEAPAVDGIGQSTSSETIVLDPVTTSAVATSVDVTAQSINVSTADGAVLDAIPPEVVATDELSMETNEGQDILASAAQSASIHVINPSSESGGIVIDSVASAVDVITPTLVPTSVGIISESVPVAAVSSGDIITAVSSVDIITPDNLITVPADTIILEATPTDVLSMETNEGQDFLTSSVEMICQSTEPESTELDLASATTVDTPVIDTTAVVSVAESVPPTTIIVSSEDVVTTDKVEPVPAEVSSESTPDAIPNIASSDEQSMETNDDTSSS